MQGPKQSKSRSHTKNTSFATLHLKRRPIKQHLRVLRSDLCQFSFSFHLSGALQCTGLLSVFLDNH